MKKRLYLSLLLGCATGAMSACGGSGSSSSSTSPTPITTTSASPAVDPNPSFANVVQPIFQRQNCTNSSCHGQVTAAGLDLRAGASFGNLVNTPATSEPILRVIPGNPDGSYLIIKLEGRQTVGTSMPLGLPRLSTTDLTNIRNWIAQGANNN